MSNAAQQSGDPTMEEILASIRRIISEEEADAKIVEDASEPLRSVEPLKPAPIAEIEPIETIVEDAEEEDILDLTTMAPPQAAPPEVAAPAMENDIVFGDVHHPEPEFAAPPISEAEPALDEGLVAAAVIDRAGAAFDRLQRDIPLLDGQGAGTLEGVVRVLLKPLLKQWLDDNLSDIVERIVREEVQRASNRRR